MRLPRLLVLPLLLLMALDLAAQPVRDGHVEAELVSSATQITPGKPFWIALRLDHDADWHTYWKSSTTGYATSLEWDVPPGFKVGPINWPVPEIYQLDFIIDYIFEGEVLLPIRVVPPQSLEADTVTLKAAADWLMCSEVCVPGAADLTLTLKVGDDSVLNEEWGPKIANVVDQLPRVSDHWSVSALRNGDELTIDVLPKDTDATLGELYFFSGDGSIEATPKQEQEALQDGGKRLHLKFASATSPDLARIQGVLRAEKGWGTEGRPGILVDVPLITAAAAQGIEQQGSAAYGDTAGAGESPIAAEATLPSGAQPMAAVAEAPDAERSLLSVLGLALLGGLILNLMPCVFPVLGIKIMGFVQQAGQSRQKVALHGLAFTSGVLLSFWALVAILLVLRGAGAGVGWGFQLQSPVFVFILAVVMLLFGLNMSGVFEVGNSLTSVGGVVQGRKGLGGSFLSGVLATVVATPCSAPFLVAALGYALVQPPAKMFLVFTAVGIGLSLPYLILSAFPALLRFLPRPGRWMETFKQALAFLLYASVAYLVWTVSPALNNERVYGPYGLLLLLVGLVLAAVAAWAYGRWTQPGASKRSRGYGWAAGIVFLAAAFVVGIPKSANVSSGSVAIASARSDSSARPAFLEGESKPYFVKWHPDLAEELAAQGHPVWIDFTARWCPTCQANKIAMFSSQELRDAFRNRGVVALKADWTAQDPEITQELARWGKAAVPFNLLYLPGREEPLQFPPLLTPSIVLDALKSSDGDSAQ